MLDARNQKAEAKIATIVGSTIASMIAIESIRMVLSAAATGPCGSRMFIDPKKAVSVDELLHGEIVQSGNDAAIALAEVTAGSEAAFVERMNREAASHSFAARCISYYRTGCIGARSATRALSIQVSIQPLLSRRYGMRCRSNWRIIAPNVLIVPTRTRRRSR